MMLYCASKTCLLFMFFSDTAQLLFGSVSFAHTARRCMYFYLLTSYDVLVFNCV